LRDPWELDGIAHGDAKEKRNGQWIAPGFFFFTAVGIFGPTAPATAGDLKRRCFLRKKADPTEG
jgi:hypothetical protein